MIGAAHALSFSAMFWVTSAAYSAFFLITFVTGVVFLGLFFGLGGRLRRRGTLAGGLLNSGLGSRR
jgi:hypothetical protein